jgi:hypothetical protein
MIAVSVMDTCLNKLNQYMKETSIPTFTEALFSVTNLESAAEVHNNRSVDK